MTFGDIKIGEKIVFNPFNIGFFEALVLALIGVMFHPALFVFFICLWIVQFIIRALAGLLETAKILDKIQVPAGDNLIVVQYFLKVGENHVNLYKETYKITDNSV